MTTIAFPPVVWRAGVGVVLGILLLTGSGPLSGVPSIAWRLVLVALTVLLTVLSALGCTRAGLRAVRTPAILCAAFVTCALVSSAFSRFTSAALAQTAILALMLSFVVLTAAARWHPASPRHELYRDIRFLILFLAAVSILAWLLGIARVSWAIGPYDRLTGTFSNANYLGMIAALAATGALVLVAQEHDRARRLWLAATAVAVLPALAWSGSRGAMLACAVGGLVVMVVRRWWWAAIVSGVLAIAASVVLVTVVASRLDGGDISSGRLQILGDALRLAMTSPVFGIGYRTLELQPAMAGRTAHNTLVSVAVETGAVGLVVFVALLGVLMWQGRAGMWLGPVVAVLVMEQTESSMLGWAGATALPFWLLLFAHAASRGAAVIAPDTRGSRRPDAQPPSDSVT